MLTSKERSNLKALASKETAIMQVGKGGIGDNLISSLSDALDKRELIKITVLENAEETSKEVGAILAANLKAEFVAAIGRKVILYRRSQKEGVKHIEF